MRRLETTAVLPEPSAPSRPSRPPPVPVPVPVPVPRWWASRRARLGGALGLAAGSGLVAAAALPRGPTTGAQVLWLMLGTVAVGLVAGVVTAARWSALAAPALHLLVYEALRATLFQLPGPTFDRPRFDVTMGVVLFVAVHVMYAAVALSPMVLGALAGAAIVRRRARAGSVRTGRTWPQAIGRGVRVALVVALAAGTGLLAVQLVTPGRVAPVLDDAGRPVAGSVATLTKVRLGGVDQWVSIRGRSADNPVLLHLSGGPGSSDVGWVRTFNQPLEDRFTVVVWEQRGVGKSYPALDPTATFTLDRLVDDGIELSRWLADRFDQQKIYLTGNSWGSTLGVLMAQRRPELYWAYVGTGQMVSQRETDRVLYQQLLDHAARTGDDRLAARLRELGAPPYRDVLGYAKVMEYYDVIEPYQHAAAYERARGLAGFFPSEYSLLDTWNEVRGFADMGGLLYPQLQGLDLRASVPRLEVPVYFIQGRHELTARSRFADEWIAQVQAPIKRRFDFAGSGHNPDAEEPARFNDVLIHTVLPETFGRG